MCDRIVIANNLYKSYFNGGTKVDAVKDVSLAIKAGEIKAFLGPNGAGKTTTIKMLTGLVEPDNGCIKINGVNPYEDTSILREIGTVLEGNRNLYWKLTPLENLEYFGALKGVRKHEVAVRGAELLDQFGLTEKRKTQVQALSRGMQQKVAIAVALIHRPRLILLDEPTLGLDAEASHDMKEMIKNMSKEGHAVLLTTHQLNVAEEISDSVAIMKSGEVVLEESTDEVIRRFSGESYVVTVSGTVDKERSRDIEGLGAVFSGGKIILRGRPDELYSLLNILCPIPILKVEKDQANLTDVFLKVVGGTA